MTGVSIEMFDAGAGDAFAVRTGPDTGNPWIAVIDGGPPGTPDRGLKQWLRNMATPIGSQVNAAAYVDLLAVTHIDSDHIGGAIDLLADTPATRTSGGSSFKFGAAWHNSFADLTGDSVLVASGQVQWDVQSRLALAQTAADDRAPAVVGSVPQGVDLESLIARNGLSGNQPFNGLVHQGQTARFKNGPIISIVGPNQDQIDALKRYWKDQVNRNVIPSRRIAAAAASIDQSVTNLASLVFLLEYGGRRILFTGDARGDHVVQQLANLGHVRKGPLEVDVLKVPHHGSDRSCGDELFHNVMADHYLFSGDGSNGNPSPLTATRLCRARPRDNFAVWLTHDIPLVTKRFRAHQGVKVIVRPPQMPNISISI